jgi:redox-sensitive bicupin YhaK (pirin superfamily)
VQSGHTSFCYVFDGGGAFGGSDADAGRSVARGQLAVFSDGDVITVSASETSVRFLLLAGKPLREPVARYGPFVMNTKEEILKAFEDFRRGTFLD